MCCYCCPPRVERHIARSPLNNPSSATSPSLSSPSSPPSGEGEGEKKKNKKNKKNKKKKKKSKEQEHCMAFPTKGGPVGLSKVCHFLFGKPISKDMQVSNWSRRPLLPAQIEYAALDAFILVKIKDRLWPSCSSSSSSSSSSPSSSGESPKLSDVGIPVLGSIQSYLTSIGSKAYDKAARKKKK